MLGPPPRARTPGGSPPGSTPTEKAVAGSASGTSISESLPGRPPIWPNSSPPSEDRARPMPRRASCSNNQRAESDLSVRPISTCLTSLVTRGSPRPASRAAASASAATSVNPSSPAADSRPSTAASSSSILAFGGSAHSCRGIRSIFRRFSRSRDDLRPQAALGQPRDRCVSGSAERVVLLRRRDSPMDQDGTVQPDREHL